MPAPSLGELFTQLLGQGAGSVSPLAKEGPYETTLAPEQEMQYQVWRARLPQGLQYEGDYDLRGAFLSDMKQSANAHLGDRFKKPNHPSFSRESQYARPNAPFWTRVGDRMRLTTATGQVLADEAAE